MFRALTKLVLVLVVLAGLAYAGIHWKINNAVEKTFASIKPFADAQYDGVTFDPSGRIEINGIRIFMPSTGISLSLGSIGFATTNLLELLTLETKISKYELPKRVRVDIKALSLALNPSLLSLTSKTVLRDRFSELSQLACGAKKSSPFQQLKDLGYQELAGDFEVGYDFDELSGDLNSFWFATLTGVAKIELYGKQKNASDIMADFRRVADFENVSNQIQFNQKDLGYNKRFISACASNREMDEEDWLSLHYEAMLNALKLLEIDVNDEIKTAYKAYLSPGSEISLALSPPSGAVFENMGWYEASDVPGLLGISIIVNNKNIPVNRLGWNPAKWSDVSLRISKHASLVADRKRELAEGSTGKLLTTGKAERPATRNLAVENPVESTLAPEYKTTSLDDVQNFIDYPIRIVRKDGREFGGKLKRFDGKKYWLDMASGGGSATIPVNINDVSEVLVFR